MKLPYYLLFLIAASMSSCGLECVTGTGKPISEERSLGQFNSILLDCSANVNIVQDQTIDVPIVEVVAQKELLSQLSLFVERDQLVVDMTGCTINSTPVIVNVTVNDLQEVVLDGSGDIYGEDVIQAETFKVIIDGSGNIDLWLACTKIDVLVDGSGDATLQGKCKSMDIDVDGSGDVNAFGLTSEKVSVIVDGSGDCNVNATRELTVEVDGSGDVEYMGDPDVSVSDDGSGNVSEAN